MHFRRRSNPAFAPAHLTQGMRRDIPAPDGWPHAVVPLLHLWRPLISVVPGGDQPFVIRAVRFVGQIRTAGIPAGFLWFPWHCRLHSKRAAGVSARGPHPDFSNVNDMSIVCKISYGNTSFLIGGDAEWDAEHDLVDAGLDLSADVLRVNHHGSNTSSTYIFLRAVMPTYAIISSGVQNQYGHPMEETLSRLQDVGAIIMRTDQRGTIKCVSDGNSIDVN